MMPTVASKGSADEGATTRRTTSLLPLRFAMRELRGGLRGFYVFIACIALGVMAIAGVSSVASGLVNGLAREGRVILGGDLAFTLSLREASAAERAFLDRAGRVSVAATMRAMARTADRRTALVEVKGSTPPILSMAPSRSTPLITPQSERKRRVNAPMLREGTERASPRSLHRATAHSVPPLTRPCWRGSILSLQRASCSGMRR
jgi:putative ABC transport system permease protein